MANLLQMAGAQPQKQPRYTPLFIDRCFTGLFSQRAALHDPSDLATQRYFNGRPDSLLDGVNIELTNRLTLQRRPGLAPFSTAIYPTPPNRAFSFELTNGTIQVIIDTGSTTGLAVHSVSDSVGPIAVYTGGFPDGGSNAYVGLKFQIAGFSTGTNNGTFVVTASDTGSITVSNASAVAETATASGISSGGIYYDMQSAGMKTLLFAKSPGAGQAYFVAVGGILYIGDGIDQVKYTPGNTNGTAWNWGIASPTSQPGVVVTESGSAAVAWAANTWFSTMGILIDSNGNSQQLISVNADGTNPSSQFGLSGNGGPNWNQIPGGVTSDGTITWTNRGPIGIWQANHNYSGIATFGTPDAPAIIYDPVSDAFYANSFSGTKTSGNFKPAFNGVLFSNYFDGSCNWVCYPKDFIWQLNHVYGAVPPFIAENDALIEPFAPPFPTNSTAYYQTSGGGTSQATPYTPVWGTAAGIQAIDKQLQWVCLGSATWAPNTAYSAWTQANLTNFNCVQDTAGCLQVCIQTGTSGTSAPWHIWQATFAYSAQTVITDTNGYLQTVTVAGTSGGSTPSWNTTVGGTTSDGGVTWINSGPAYGSTTTDNGVVWTNVGLAANAVWTANQSYYLPKTGFSAPNPFDPYGGSDVFDTNNNVQFTISTGVSGGSHPSWNPTKTGLTGDNTVLWYNNGPLQTNSLTWTKGYTYAYSFKSRTATDFYVTNAPPGWATPLGAPTGSGTGVISTASPVATITGPNAGAVNTISGVGSTDPQVDTIVIWRSADGGGAANMFELTEIPAPLPIGGVAQSWSFQDYLPDLPTSVYPGLNNLIPAPIDDENDPPPVGFLPMVYNFQRIWGSVNNEVFFSGGPDVITGNPNESFNPADEFPYLATVVRLVKTSQGLVTFLTNSIELIAGGPSTASFYPVTLAQGIGLGDYNALDIYAGEIYFMSSDSQAKILSPSLNLSNFGFPIGDRLTQFNAMTAQVAVQQSGTDSCIMFANGFTGWYRVNPRQVPGGPNGPEPVWSPFANITGGCQMVQSVEISPGVRRLLVGANTNSKKILQRDITVFTDDGVPYGANFIMGSIVLAHPGQLAILKFLEADFSGLAFQPTISYLLNEISGTFTPFTAAPQFDPPSIYGNTTSPSSYSPNRYYFSGTGSLARCRHMQIKVDYGTNSTGSELFDLTIFGRLTVEY